jgi:acetate kinase
MHPVPRTALTLNAGSSSLKVSLFALAETEERAGTANFDHIEDPGRIGEAAREALTSLPGGRDRPPDVIAHRIVHGGLHHIEPERVTKIT